MPKSRTWVVVMAALVVSSALAQQGGQTPPVVRTAYLLGPDDVLSIKATDAEEMSDKAIRIGADGYINLPLVGRLRAEGLSPEELEKQLVAKLKAFIRNPEIIVNVVELRSQPVSILGAVTIAGVHQLQGRKTLVELISQAGGLRPDAGNSVTITRQIQWGPIPVDNAAVDASGQFSVAEVSLKDIMDAKKPVDNILIRPNDVISVSKAQLVYVIGDVKKSGGFVLNDQGRVSVLQAVSMAAGLEKSAAQSKAKILRASGTSDLKRTEIPVNLKNILAGKDEDIAMRPDDILYVPGSKSRPAAIRALEIALQVGTGVAIYRSYQ